MSAMNAIRRGGVAMALLVTASLVASASLSPAQAQTPHTNCAPPFDRGAGGQTISTGLIRVDLPAGYNYVWNAPSVGTLGGTLRICVIEYFSQITINTNTGAEISRVVAVAS